MTRSNIQPSNACATHRSVVLTLGICLLPTGFSRTSVAGTATEEVDGLVAAFEPTGG